MISALLLAAGSSSRFGGQKLLAPLHGKPLLRWSAEALTYPASPVEEVVVVTGANDVAIRELLDGIPAARPIVNPNASRGVGASIAWGVSHLAEATEAVVIALGDEPRPSRRALELVVARWREGGASIVVPEFSGTRGHPVLFDRSVFGELRALDGDSGARAIVDRDPSRVAIVPLDEPPPLDVDTPADVAKLAEGSTTRFLDLFSRQAATYAYSRPGYPAELFDFLTSLVSRTRLAWDCATGNGQAAVDLARRFARVIATDASAAQIAEAVPVANVEYRVATAEESGLDSRSVDMVCVAQALHWFDFARFESEVRRVTVPGGVVAAWSYGTCHAGEDIEPLLRQFEYETVGPYWNPRRRWLDEGYRTIPFSFENIEAPAFQLRVSWTLPQLGAYLNSWSAVAKYREVHGTDPVEPLLEEIGNHWGTPGAPREITWPLALRVGRVGG